MRLKRTEEVDDGLPCGCAELSGDGLKMECWKCAPGSTWKPWEKTPDGWPMPPGWKVSNG